MSDIDQRAAALRAIAWLVERHHQSLGLWPWTWTGPNAEVYVTLYARCTALRFKDDFGALAHWLEANRWPSPAGEPHPATFYRDRLDLPEWSLRPPTAGETPATRRTPHPDLMALARAGSPIETVAQLMEAASDLDLYLAMLAPQRHGGHPHREASGRLAVLMMMLATEAALVLGEDYTIPWTGPGGDHLTDIPYPDWTAFARRYQLANLPFPLIAHDTFAFGERGWLHAAGWAGDRHGNLIRLSPAAPDSPAYAAARALTLQLLGAGASHTAANS